MTLRLTWLSRTGPVHDPSSEDVLRVEYATSLRNALARWPFAETVQVEGGAEHVLGFGRWLRGTRRAELRDLIRRIEKFEHMSAQQNHIIK